MKKIISLFCTVLVLLSLTPSCKKDDNSTSNTNSNLSSTIQQGTWKVTSYIDSGTDETNHYTGYAFQFNSNGTVVATKTGSTVNGTWSNGTDDSQVKLYLDFGATNPFDELNDDWDVLEQSSTIIKLQDVSGGGSGTDYLTFEKN
jgi:hypothetical protein